MDENQIRPPLDKNRMRRISRQIDDLCLCIERYHELLDRAEESILDLGHEFRALFV